MARRPRPALSQAVNDDLRLRILVEARQALMQAVEAPDIVGMLADEIDEATESVQCCVCRELGRIYKLNGSIPPRWMPQWEKYECGTRVQTASARALQGHTEGHHSAASRRRH